MNPILKQTLSVLKNPHTLVYLAFASVFVHYVITAAVIILLGFYLVLNPNTAKKVFAFKGKGVWIAFTVYALLIALFHKNYIGAACTLGFFFIFAISYYTRSIITEQVFENCLDLCCFAAFPLTFSAIIEKLLHMPKSEEVQIGLFNWLLSSEYRCAGWCFNPNYLCALFAAIIIICAFKVTSHKKNKNSVFVYYFLAATAAVGLYLGGSLFALVEVFVGLCVLLVLQRKHLMLAMFLAAVGISIVMIFFIPNLLPRLSESEHTTDLRVIIWDQAMGFIKENPLFGRGFLTFYQHYLEDPVNIYYTTHAHNFALEGLLSFGVVGCVLILMLLWSYYRKVTECKELLRSNCATTLILTISAAVLIHMTTDMTIIWMQTALLYLLIMGGVGIDEKALDKRILACAQGGGLSDRRSNEKDNEQLKD